MKTKKDTAFLLLLIKLILKIKFSNVILYAKWFYQDLSLVVSFLKKPQILLKFLLLIIFYLFIFFFIEKCFLEKTNN